MCARIRLLPTIRECQQKSEFFIQFAPARFEFAKHVQMANRINQPRIQRKQPPIQWFEGRGRKRSLPRGLGFILLTLLDGLLCTVSGSRHERRLNLVVVDKSPVFDTRSESSLDLACGGVKLTLLDTAIWMEYP
jgi:hypothetical protein